MKFRKTPSSQRGTYKYVYYDDNGKFIVELVPGVDGVTELDILECHRADDREVYNNIKNSRPKLSVEEKQQIKEWEENHHDDWSQKNWNLSLDSVTIDDGAADKSVVLFAASNIKMSENTPDPMVERLREVVELLTPDQQSLYHKIVIEEIPQVEIAEQLGITKQALQSRWKKIQTKIKKLF